MKFVHKVTDKCRTVTFYCRSDSDFMDLIHGISEYGYVEAEGGIGWESTHAMISDIENVQMIKLTVIGEITDDTVELELERFLERNKGIVHAFALVKDIDSSICKIEVMRWALIV